MDATNNFHDVVVVTGALGSGKSSFVQILKELGAYTVNADELARQVVAPGSVGLKRVVQHFGPDILLKDGSLNRKKLAQKVFSQPDARKELESILHPLIHSQAKEEFNSARGKNFPLLVYDCPLFFEAGLQQLGFRKVVAVVSSPEICLARVMKRDGMSEEQAKLRSASQLPIEEKIKGADIVVDNSGSLLELVEKATKIFKDLTTQPSD